MRTASWVWIRKQFEISIIANEYAYAQTGMSFYLSPLSFCCCSFSSLSFCCFFYVSPTWLASLPSFALKNRLTGYYNGKQFCTGNRFIRVCIALLGFYGKFTTVNFASFISFVCSILVCFVSIGECRSRLFWNLVTLKLCVCIDIFVDTFDIIMHWTSCRHNKHRLICVSPFEFNDLFTDTHSHTYKFISGFPNRDEKCGVFVISVIFTLIAWKRF